MVKDDHFAFYFTKIKGQDQFSERYQAQNLKSLSIHSMTHLEIRIMQFSRKCQL